jgi:hypothetical protein
LPDKNDKSRLGLLGRPLVYFLVFIAGGVLLLRLDPFGLTRVTKIYSQDLLAVAMAGCYPGAPPGRCVAAAGNAAGKAQIAVVLLADRDLELAEESWPPSYGFHARVLRAIRAQKPKAVFMDIVFEDRRDDPSIADLQAELEKYEQEGIRIYAATFGADRSLRPEVAAHVTPALVPKRIDPLDRVTRFYDLRTHASEPQLTLAPTVLRDVCGGGADAGIGDVETIRVFWATSPADSWNHRWLDCRIRPPFPGWIFQNRDSDFRDSCPFNATVPARVLLEPEETDDAAIAEMLGGAVVLYGAFFRGAADAMNTPLHNELPGVFLHAAALDNLITLGAEPLRHAEHMVPGLGVAWADLVLLAVVGAFLSIRNTSTRFDAWWGRTVGRVRSRLLRVVMIMLGSQIGMLFLVVGGAAALACSLGISHWVFGFGFNFLFAVAWTEVLDITERLFEVADEMGETAH